MAESLSLEALAKQMNELNALVMKTLEAKGGNTSGSNTATSSSINQTPKPQRKGKQPRRPKAQQRPGQAQTTTKPKNEKMKSAKGKKTNPKVKTQQNVVNATTAQSILSELNFGSWKELPAEHFNAIKPLLKAVTSIRDGKSKGKSSFLTPQSSALYHVLKRGIFDASHSDIASKVMFTRKYRSILFPWLVIRSPSGRITDLATRLMNIMEREMDMAYNSDFKVNKSNMLCAFEVDKTPVLGYSTSQPAAMLKLTRLFQTGNDAFQKEAFTNLMKQLDEIRSNDPARASVLQECNLIIVSAKVTRYNATNNGKKSFFYIFEDVHLHDVASKSIKQFFVPTDLMSIRSRLPVLHGKNELEEAKAQTIAALASKSNNLFNELSLYFQDTIYSVDSSDSDIPQKLRVHDAMLSKADRKFTLRYKSISEALNDTPLDDPKEIVVQYKPLVEKKQKNENKL